MISAVTCRLPGIAARSTTAILHRTLSTSSVCDVPGTTGGSREVKKVTVIGGGLMGADIVQVNAQNGYHVTVVDTDEFLQKCMVRIDY